MRKTFSYLLRVVCAAVLLFTFAGKASAAYPTQNQLVGKTYTFKGTLSRVNDASTYDARYNALATSFENFEFKVDAMGMSLTLNNFILNQMLYASYDESTGTLTLTSKQGGIIGAPTPQVYLSANDLSGDQSTAVFQMQVAEDGIISIPDFYVRDYNSDIIFAKYSDITTTTELIEAGGDTSSYPAAGEFDGWYKYTCNDFTLNNKAYEFSNEITFQVTSSAGSVSIVGFFTPINCDYDQTTGTLTLNTLYFKPADSSTYIGIAPVEGGWKGMSGMTGNKLKWQISEDGEITIPAFDLITFTGTTVDSTIATYGEDSKVVPTEEPGEEPDPSQDYSNFAGNYTFHGTQTQIALPNFSGFATVAETLQNANISFTINEYGQIVKFNNYILEDTKIGPNYLNNKGELSEDNSVYTISMETFNGVEWNYGNEEQQGAYSIFFGAPAEEWDQGNVAFTLTKTATGYELSPVALAIKYSYAEGESNMNVTENWMEWTNLVEGEYLAPDFTGIEAVEGTWTIPMTDAPYLGELKAFNADYVATLDGTIVTFTEIVEGKEGTYNLVGQFTDATTIRFDKAVVGDATVKYPTRMIPFINNGQLTGTNWEELAALYQAYDVTYDAEEGTLTFPANSGVLFVNSDDSYAPSGSTFDPKGNWLAAFNFNGEGQFGGSVPASLSINRAVINEGTVTVDVYPANFVIEEEGTWTATVKELDTTGDVINTWNDFTVTIGEGTNLDGETVTTASIEFNPEDLAAGPHNFTITLNYSYENLDVTSNAQAFTLETGSYLEVTNVGYEIDYDAGYVVVSFDVKAYNVEEEVSYEVTFTPVTEETEAPENAPARAAAASITVPATVDENGHGTALLSNLPEGTYYFTVTVNAIANDEVIASSEANNQAEPEIEFTLTEDIAPQVIITISDPQVQTIENNATVGVTVEITGIDIDNSGIIGWVAIVQELDEDGEPMDDPVNYTADVKNNKASFFMTGLTTGPHNYTLVLRANTTTDVYYESENEVSFEVNAGFFFELTNAEAVYEEGEVTVTFDVVAYNTPNVEITYKAIFSYEENGETVEVSVPATVTDGKGEAQITGLPAGTYTYQFVIEAYNANGDLIGITTGGTIPEVEVTVPKMLYAEDFEMTIRVNSEDAVEVPVNVDLNILEGTPAQFLYKGFQFDIQLPMALSIPVEGGVVVPGFNNDKVTPNVSLYNEDENIYRVIVGLTDVVETVNDIVTLNIAGSYIKDEVTAVNTPIVYDVEISNVIFSTGTGDDITDIVGGTSQVTITYEEVNADSITIESVEIEEPSYSDSDEVTEITVGENLTVTVLVEPANTTDNINPTIDPNNKGVTIEEEEWYYVDAEGNRLESAEGATGIMYVFTVNTEEAEITEDTEFTFSFNATDMNDEETVSSEEYKFTLKTVLLGDSNNNGKVNVADVVTTANYIADLEVEAFCFPNANVILTPNDEGEQVINAQDLTATVNIILEDFDGERNPSNIRRQARNIATNDALVVDNFNVTDGQFTIGVSLDNTYDYAALQASVIVPEGMRVIDVTAGPRAAAHEYVANITEDGRVNVVFFSFENASFMAAEGALFNLVVEADAECGNIAIENIQASDAESNGYMLSCAGGQNATSGIIGIDSDAENGVRYFNIQGVEVKNPEAGSILIRVENGKATKVVK